MANVINCGNKSLPRSVDVNVVVTTPQAEFATDLTLACLVVSSGDLPIGAGRVRIYSDVDSVIADWTTDSEPYKAARDFFAVQTAPTQFAVGQAFSVPQAGFLTTGETGDLAAFTSITDGSFAVSIDAVSYDVTGLDFSTATSLDDVATTITAGLTGATAIHNGTSFIITSSATGDSSTVSVLETVDPVSGTDISVASLMNGRLGEATTQPGYTPAGIASELALIQDAAGCQNKFIYAWLLDKTYRDSQDALDVAAYIESQEKAVFFTTSNDPLALNPSITTDIGSELSELGYLRTADPIYHDNVEYYPDAALAATMLGVNYSGTNTAITAKFKNFPGVPTVGVTISEWRTLKSKGYNTFTRTGNTARTFREGTMISPVYFIDDRINLDNFAEELETAIYNVFLRNGKVPYTPQGQVLIEDGAATVCEKYVENGVFADRIESSTTVKSGTIVQPAYSIVSDNIALASASDRAQRIAPPLTITVYLAGAIHSIDVIVNAIT